MVPIYSVDTCPMWFLRVSKQCRETKSALDGRFFFSLTPKRDGNPHLDVCGESSLLRQKIPPRNASGRRYVNRYLPLLFYQLVLHWITPSLLATVNQISIMSMDRDRDSVHCSKFLKTRKSTRSKLIESSRSELIESSRSELIESELIKSSGSELIESSGSELIESSGSYEVTFHL